jgi:hypothetical protein
MTMVTFSWEYYDQKMQRPIGCVLLFVFFFFCPCLLERAVSSPLRRLSLYLIPSCSRLLLVDIPLLRLHSAPSFGVSSFSSRSRLSGTLSAFYLHCRLPYRPTILHASSSHSSHPRSSFRHTTADHHCHVLAHRASHQLIQNHGYLPRLLLTLVRIFRF